MDKEFDISYVDTLEECAELHRFLCVVAAQVLLAPIDAQDSMSEVVRVRDFGVSLIARCDGEIIGALGLTTTALWYNRKAEYFTDRWFFVYPAFQNMGVSAALLAEASSIAFQAGLPLVIQGKLKRRALHVGNGINFTLPRVIETQPLNKEAPSDVLRRH